MKTVISDIDYETPLSLFLRTFLRISGVTRNSVHCQIAATASKMITYVGEYDRFIQVFMLGVERLWGWCPMMRCGAGVGQQAAFQNQFATGLVFQDVPILRWRPCI